ncbi:STAS domain-containing protein [Streptomyces sp. NPDC013953]|uniref:STAS domain-containing protein n=1 Tax=Streptomyces sp. NPDC013953 TaxID=3364868 RepID=UPI0036FDCBCA
MTTPSDADGVATPTPAGPHTVRLALTGDLDYDTSGELLDQVHLALRDRADVDDLRLDCRKLGTVDSTGLSALLQIHRSAGRDGIGFHLDNIGPALQRLLDLTGTYEYLTTPQQSEPANENRNN